MILLVISGIILSLLGFYGIHIAVRGWKPRDPDWYGVLVGVSPALLFMGILALLTVIIP